MNKPAAPKPDLAAPAPAALAGGVVSAGQLLRGARELWIEHRGERYRLYLTRNEKLILTK